MKKANDLSKQNNAKQVRLISKTLHKAPGKFVPCKLVQSFLFPYFLQDK